MEAVAATSAVLQIIAFAGKGLSTIHDLQQTCFEFSPHGRKEFFHDLEVTVSILLQAKELAEHIQLEGISLGLDYRAQALRIQVDDCTQDVEDWLRTARGIVRPEKKSSIIVSKHLFFPRILSAFTRHTRITARSKLRDHVENISTTLSIFGRCV